MNPVSPVHEVLHRLAVEALMILYPAALVVIVGLALLAILATMSDRR